MSKSSSSIYKQNSIPQIINHILLWLLLLVLLYPLGLTLWDSLKGPLDFQYSKWYPTFPLWIDNYVQAFDAVWRYIFNTIVVGCIGTLGMLIQSSIAAFVFARMKFFGKELLYTLVISLMMVPGVLTLVPLYMSYKQLNLLNSYWALIIPMWTAGPVFGIFLLRQFFSALPEETFEAAKIDGSSNFGLFYRICVPLSLPILGTLAVMSVVGAWNDLLWPMITIQSDSLLTVSAGLVMRFSGTYTNNFTLLFAGYVLSSLPLVILFLFTSKYYVEGLTSSAMKL